MKSVYQFWLSHSRWILILLACGPALIARAAGEPPKLILAQILFRHGMRAPEEPYPTDPFQDASRYWPNGWGQLTDFGKEQQYQLGKYLRSRYVSFLSPHYVPEEIQVVSSGYDRTVASALLMLAGLYPNTAPRNQYEYSRLTWQPIPIQTVNSGSNTLMMHPSYISKRHVCPRAYDLIQEVDSHSVVKKAVEENRGLIENLRNWTGIGETKSWKHIAAGYMGGVKIEKFYNLSIPKWADDVISSPSNLEFFASVFSYLSLTPEMKRLTAGPILSEWVHHMRNLTDGNKNETSTATIKLYVYSAHDLNLVNVLNTMGLNDPPTVPSMGSTLFVELYDNLEVLLSYRDGITKVVTVLKPPGCGEQGRQCTLDSFERMLKPYLVEDLYRECGVNGREGVGLGSAGSVSVLEAVLIAIICVLTLMLIALEIYHRKRRSKSKMYAIETK